MKKKFFFISFITLSLFVVAPALAEGNYGLDQTAGKAGLTSAGANVPTLAGNLIGTALSLVGVLFFILMIYGGFLWMTARGNEEATTKALGTITAAIIGIIIIMASYAITNFVFKSVQGGGSCIVKPGLIGPPRIGCSGLSSKENCEAPGTGGDCVWR